jgi:polyisoprenoid-binding protein YceI
MTFSAQISVITRFLQYVIVPAALVLFSFTDAKTSNNTMTSENDQAATTWQIDPAHTQVEFVVTHMMFAKVRGGFNTFSGTLVQGDDGDLASGSFSATIAASSIDTGNGDRDNHLRSADFFDTDNHAEITFESTEIERVSETSMKVTGDLTIRGVTKSVTLDVTETGTGVDPWGNTRIGIQAEGTISRKEFGLTWNQALEAGGVLVSDEVTLMIEAQGVAQQ